MDEDAITATLTTFSSTLQTSRLSSVRVDDGKKRRVRQVSVSVGLTADQCRWKQMPMAKVYGPPPPGDFESDLVELGVFAIKKSESAFAQGGERNVYHVRFLLDSEDKLSGLKPGEPWVLKENKRVEATTAKEVEFHRTSLVTQETAMLLGLRFNQHAEACGLTNLPKVQYMTCCYVQVCHPATGLATASYFAERYLAGDHRKWNTNNGHVVVARSAAASIAPASVLGVIGEMGAIVEEDEEADESSRGAGEEDDNSTRITDEDVAQAFSHWSYSGCAPMDVDGQKCRVLICDVQGYFDAGKNWFELNDPVIHSSMSDSKSLFGATDRGQPGIDAFMKSHRCNEVCSMLGLEPNAMFEKDNFSYAETTTCRTSQISVVKTKHLKERQGERGFNTLLCQQAVKHGEKQVQEDGKVKHTLGGFRYVTDDSSRIGVTGMFLESPGSGQSDPQGLSEGPQLTPSPRFPKSFGKAVQHEILVDVQSPSAGVDIAPQSPQRAYGRGGRGGRSGRGGRGGRGLGTGGVSNIESWPLGSVASANCASPSEALASSPGNGPTLSPGEVAEPLASESLVLRHVRRQPATADLKLLSATAAVAALTEEVVWLQKRTRAANKKLNRLPATDGEAQGQLSTGVHEKRLSLLAEIAELHMAQAEAEAEAEALGPQTKVEMDALAEVERMKAVERKIDQTTEDFAASRERLSKLNLIPTTTDRQVQEGEKDVQNHRRLFFSLLPHKYTLDGNTVAVLPPEWTDQRKVRVKEQLGCAMQEAQDLLRRRRKEVDICEKDEKDFGKRNRDRGIGKHGHEYERKLQEFRERNKQALARHATAAEELRLVPRLDHEDNAGKEEYSVKVKKKRGASVVDRLIDNASSEEASISRVIAGRFGALLE